MDDKMTAEEVEKAKFKVRAIFKDIESEYTETLAALSRIAAQAALVPGLEQMRDDALDLLRSALATLQHLGSTHAISESAYQELATYLDDEPLGEEGERITTRAESERDAAKQEAEGNENAWRVSSTHADALKDENATLRERVATLAAETEKWKEAARAVNELHDTAEARVKELEAWKAHALALRSLAGVYNSVVATLPEEAQAPFGRAGVAIVACALLNNEPTATFEETQSGYARYCELLGQHPPSHPAPSTGTVGHNPPEKGCDCQDCRNANEAYVNRGEPMSTDKKPTPPPGLLDLLGDFLTAVAATPRNPYPTEDDPRAAGWADALDAMRESANTLSGALNAARASRVSAPPGLLEAVGPFLPLMRELAGQRLESHVQAHLSALHAQDVEVGHVRALVAAYDAAKGGEHGPDATCPNCKADHEDAAKYRAAVELAKDTDGMARVIWDATPHHYDDVEPWPPPEAFQEGLADDIRGVAKALASHLLGLTLDTPPSGPGGGEDERTVGVRRAREERSRMEAEGYPRIAPTPTPEVPPMARVSRAHGGHMGPKAVHDAIAYAPPPMQRDASLALYSLAADYTNLRTTCAAESLARDVSLSEPSTPDVVWEGAGLTVLADGSCKGFGLLDPVGVCKALARALAEAKREASEMRKAHEAVQYAARNVSWAKAGGEVVAMHSERLRDGAEKAAREAAESMRERAKQAILKQLAEEEDGLSSDDRGYSALMLRRLADAVGKLPLE